MSSKTNIVLISIDSLRRDHLGCYGYSKNTSPNIDTLASNGVLFSQAISNGGGTPEAFPAILASVPPPLYHPFTQAQAYRDYIKGSITIAEVLKENGYQTAAFHSNPYLSSLYNYGKGFTIFDDGIKASQITSIKRKVGRILSRNKNLFELLHRAYRYFSKGIQPPHERADEINKKAISWLNNCSGNSFLWLHYMDVHHPYMPPTEYVRQYCPRSIGKLKMLELQDKFLRQPEKLSDNETGLLINLYDASIRYVDHAIGVLLHELEEICSDSILIVTADHGDEFGEHGKSMHRTLYDPIIRVPLIISGQGINGGVIVRDQVAHLDLAPTIVDLLGVGRVKDFHGKSLLPLVKGESGMSHDVISVAINPPNEKIISYRMENWKYIYTISGIKNKIKRELYNLQDDPGEISNLQEKEKDRAKVFETKILDYISKSGAPITEEDRIRGKIKELKFTKKIK